MRRIRLHSIFDCHAVGLQLCGGGPRVAQPEASPAHDAFTRLLHWQEPEPGRLWQETAPYVGRTGGVLVIDDSTDAGQAVYAEDGLDYPALVEEAPGCSPGHQLGGPAVDGWG